MIDFDAVDLDAAYDPDPLRPGDRVALRPRPECTYCKATIKELPLFDGQTGRIIECTAVGERFGDAQEWHHVHAPGHVYGVWLERFVRTERFGVVVGGCFARAELERLP